MNIPIAFDGSAHADAAIDDLASAGLPDRASAVVLSVVDAWLPEEAPPGGKADEALPALKDIRAAVTRRVDAQREIAERGAAPAVAAPAGARRVARRCAAGVRAAVRPAA